MALPRISLEQWATFKAVVDCGSFASAAEMLNKSQSAVSYAIAKMEQQLPTPALAQQGRKAVLTDAGKVLYRQATNLLNQAHAVEAHANYLAAGWQAEVTLAVDAVVDMAPIIAGLAEFSAHHPETRIRLLETTLSATDDALLERTADLVYSVRVLPGFIGKPVAESSMACVVSPAHPLASKTQPVSSDELKQFRQVVLRDGGTKRTIDVGWLQAEERWTVSYFGTAIDIVKQGLGFAFIPLSHVVDELADGRLQVIPLTMAARKGYVVNRVFTLQDAANPAVVELANTIDDCFERMVKT
ncbi:LysR family transcriptional regulator [Neiella marina]|uniref:LysR family transcriptional regulator n=1 Tax=Neiella holothuriorum TaxID=2870530 RepID=A0ABS7EE49_9GAMM|nr:LysR family transcriptional regulator [Neiella holothuriorum]MBW8189967.1 LysR family transcriptional regulator [Neiella holothuriorum]